MDEILQYESSCVTALQSCVEARYLRHRFESGAREKDHTSGLSPAVQPCPLVKELFQYHPLF